MKPGDDRSRSLGRLAKGDRWQGSGFDGVLSDIEMADEDGYALIRTLRALPRDRGGETPAAGLTGLSTVEVGPACYRRGSNATWRNRLTHGCW
jgi:CheY-like chemotaxis protein